MNELLLALGIAFGVASVTIAIYFVWWVLEKDPNDADYE